MAAKKVNEWVDVHAVVNDLAKQATGRKDIAVTDTASFIDLGRLILSSNDMMESFMNALALRFAETYYTARKYRGKLRSLMVTGSQWAAIYQKINGEVPDFVEDETFKIEEGKSVDQYIVRKPTATQKFFLQKATYSNFITWTRKLLSGAFTSEAAFQQFVSLLNLKMNNKLEFATENLGRACIASYIANTGEKQRVHLLTKYKAITGETLSASKALVTAPFLAWAAGQIELYTKRMGNLSVSYNKESVETHTPIGDNRLVVWDELQNAMQYSMQYNVFHADMVKLGHFEELSFWQAENNPMQIKATIKSGEGDSEISSDVAVNNIVAFCFDRYALGTKRSDVETLTTPVNARGRYANTFYHCDSLWFNDLGENGIVFLLD